MQFFDFSGIEEVEAELDVDAPCDIYNLNGAKVGESIDALAPGIYIVHQGNNVKKIAVK